MSANSHRTRQEGGDHYLGLSIQPWDAMKSWMTREQFTGFLIGNAIKYLGRFNATQAGKGGLMDLRKAMHYLQAAIEIEEDE